MKQFYLNKIKALLGYGVTTGLLLWGGITVYQQYPTMAEHVKNSHVDYFESSSFVSVLETASLNLAQDLAIQTGEPLQEDFSDDYEECYGSSYNRNFINLDYYVITTDQEGELFSQSDLLKPLTNSSDASLWNQLKERYQVVVKFSFDELGHFSLEEVHGVNSQQIASSLQQTFSRPHQLKNATYVFGVPVELIPDGTIYHQLQYQEQDRYFFLSLPYLIMGAFVSALTILLLPFNWIKDCKLVKGLLFVPLELRGLFVIGTCFAVLGAPILLMITQSGILTEYLSWFFPLPQVDGVVMAVNVFCWSAFLAVMATHALYVKEFFVIGPWEMLRQHTLLGQLLTFIYQEINKRVEKSNGIVVESNNEIIFDEEELDHDEQEDVETEA